MPTTSSRNIDNIVSFLMCSVGGTMTIALGDDENGRELHDQMRAAGAPIVSVISRKGGTLHVGVATEDTRPWGHNQRLNMASHLALVAKVAATEPNRVLR